MKRISWVVGLVMLSQSLPLRAADAASCAGVSLPAKEHAFGVELLLNGMGVRTVSILKIRAYVAGLYVERRTKNPAEVLQGQAKLMVLTFLQDADRSRMIDTIRRGINSQSARIQQLAQKNLRDLEQRLPDPHKGDQMVFAYSQGRLELRHHNKVAGSWNDPGLAEALFTAWLGAQPVDADLKQGLLGGECR